MILFRGTMNPKVQHLLNKKSGFYGFTNRICFESQGVNSKLKSQNLLKGKCQTYQEK